MVITADQIDLLRRYIDWNRRAFLLLNEIVKVNLVKEISIIGARHNELALGLLDQIICEPLPGISGREDIQWLEDLWEKS